MNKKLKSLIALTAVTMLTSQTIMMQVSNNVKAAGLDVQVSSAVQTNDSLGGFELVSKKWVESLKSNVCIYKHAKSGAQLIYLQNDSTDKMMCVNFRTPTKDNTGVNHVIEHSVLCGSKNYPVNEVVNQMMKQSLSTYLNAMTADDRTMYPVASKNDKDFQNLMGVYLDAIFYPNLLNDKKVFQQEGIRYELNSPNDELKYNGVVYNEMKGVYSSPDSILSRAIKQSLFPDTSYKYESGGLPEEMSKLTYDNVVKTYNANYTPSNSYFYLYGKMDIEKTLKFIGDKYLNNFDKKDVNTNIELQQPFAQSVEKTAEYSIPKGTATDNKTYLTLNYVIDKNTNKELVEAFSYIQVLLGGIPSSPITKALKDNGFGDDVSVSFDFSGAQPVLTIEAANVNENQKEQFKEVVNKTLESIVQNGFDDELLNSISKVYDLSQRMIKGDYAIGYNDLIMRSWLQGGDPTAYLNIESDMQNIKSKAKSGYFQDLIKKYLLENNHSSLLVLKPSPGLQDKKSAELKDKLAKYKDSLSKEQIDGLVQDTQEFQKWQETPPTQEQLNSLPSLSRDDISTNVKQYTTTENNEQGIKVLEHPMFTNGVDYTTLYFDTTRVPQDKLGYIYLLSGVLENIDTKNYSKEKLAEQVLINSGGISFSPKSYVNHSNNNLYSPKMVVSLVGLNENSSKYFDLLNEIIFNSNLSDKARLKTIINDLKMNEEQALSYDGNSLAIEKALSYMSKSGMYDDYANEGLYSFLCDLDANFDKKSDEIVSNLQQVRDLIFNKNDMIASYTGDKDNYNNFVNSLGKFSGNLQYASAETNTYSFDNSKINEGLIIPSDVQYVVKGGDLDKAGYTENGKFAVLQNILQSDYLWDNIRVKGGAYGAYMSAVNGDVLLSSYRDPNLKQTIDTFNKIPDYLKNFNADEKQMTNYIIGAVGQEENSFNTLNQSIGPAADGYIADAMYLTGIKQSDLQRERTEMVSTTAQDIRNFASVMDSILQQNNLCVVGGETEIEKNKDSFNSVRNVVPSTDEIGQVLDSTNKDSVDVKKTWEVKYGEGISPLTVNATNVYVLDDENQQVKVNVTCDAANNTIKVEPATPYEKGKKYTLFVKNIQSLGQDGKADKLLPDINMEFTVQK